MAYQSLYRKYRPTTFDDMVGQSHITRTLRNAIASDQLAHAYLFVGPRGTGKTTTARILAKALLCQSGAPTPDPDGTCEGCLEIATSNHPDVIELDAASRTGVENVRDEIISRVHYAPVSGTYKVYIIDEVHMLSTGAFNAMLKTLEEPPDHVIFVMCTTHPQKVPQTIRSRCQQFDFHPISTEDISGRLGYIASAEGINIDPAALPLIAKYADGGMRDAITALEQLISFAGDDIAVDDVEGMLGEIDTQSLTSLVTFVANRDTVACLQWVQSQVEVGGDLVEITRSLQEYVRDVYILSLLGVSGGIIDRTSDEIKVLAQVGELFVGPEHIARLLSLSDEAMATMRRSTNPRLVLEMMLIRATRPQREWTVEALAQRIEMLERQMETGGPAAPVTTSSAQQESPVSAASSVAANISADQEKPAVAHTPVDEQDEPATTPTPAVQISQGRAEQIWRIALTHIREVHPSRYPLFADTGASYSDEGTLVISYSADQAFRMKQAGERNNIALLSNALLEAVGSEVIFRLSAGEEVVYSPIVAVDKAEAPAAPVQEETVSVDKDDTSTGTADATVPSSESASMTVTEPESRAGSAESEASDKPNDELMGALNALGATIVDTQEVS